ncbi:MAG: transposase [Clostridia bacterium]
MYLETAVSIPNLPSGITQKTIKGTTYIYYEYARTYDRDKKYTSPQCTTIGKLCADDPASMYPNANFLKFFPDVELPEELPTSSRSGCLKMGAYLIIKKVIEHYKLDNMIREIVGRDYGLFLDLAAYTIVTENNAAQYYPDYAFNHPLFTNGMKVYSDSKISSFLRDVSRDESIRFQNEWNAGRDHREKIYISYDSTNKHCQAGDIEIAEYGHEKEKQKKPIYNFAIAYDRSNRLPLFYEQYPGSINDVSQLQYMLTKAAAYGYKNAGFILDRGYFSEPNIRFMDRHGYEFLIMVKGCKDLVNSLVLEKRGRFEDEWEHAIPYYDVSGMTVKSKLFEADEKERYFHIYYSDSRKAKEKDRLQRTIREQKEFLEGLKGKNVEIADQYKRYFELIWYHEGQPDQALALVRDRKEIITRDTKLCGYFAIITSAPMTAGEALDLYKSRDGSEKLFRGDKSYLGEKTMRVYKDEPMHTKIFIEFVALIIRNKIYTCLKDRMHVIHKKKNYMTVPAALRELDKIELIRQADGVYRLDHAVSATQKDILLAFNMNASSIAKEAERLGRELQGVTV